LPPIFFSLPCLLCTFACSFYLSPFHFLFSSISFPPIIIDRRRGCRQARAKVRPSREPHGRPALERRETGVRSALLWDQRQGQQIHLPRRPGRHGLWPPLPAGVYYCWYCITVFQWANGLYRESTELSFARTPLSHAYIYAVFARAHIFVNLRWRCWSFSYKVSEMLWYKNVLFLWKCVRQSIKCVFPLAFSRSNLGRVMTTTPYDTEEIQFYLYFHFCTLSFCLTCTCTFVVCNWSLVQSYQNLRVRPTLLS
jgi:hypothetical protein